LTRVFHTLQDVPLAREGKPAVLAFGSFDGLHRAHRDLIARVCAKAKQSGGVSAVLSFSNHPLSILAPPYCPKLLLTPERKLEILKKIGLDAVILPEFTTDLSKVSAKRFIKEFLVGRIGISHIICGYDCRFGRGGEGDGEMLAEEGKRHGFTAEIVEEMRESGAKIGSRMIRELISIGEVEHAAELLLRPHELKGRVIKGDKRGRELGFPTANLKFPPGLVVPATGVYVIRADVRRERYGGMINLGVRPTFGKMKFVPEAHLFDFSKDIYGAEMTVYFLKRLRAERRFSGPEALRRQLERDKIAAQKALQGLE
jgi:riboflavin kinase/FMN adenylyltransferase